VARKTESCTKDKHNVINVGIQNACFSPEGSSTILSFISIDTDHEVARPT